MIRPPELDSREGEVVWRFMTAAASGAAAELRRLLEHDPQLARSDYSPLRLAVRDGHLDTVTVLLEAGAEADAITFEGDTLIETARDRGYDAVASLLESARATRGRVAPADDHLDHPIHTAAEAGDLDRVRGLLDADPSVVRLGDRSGGTALHRAVIAGERRVVGLLLDRGADIHAVHGAGLGSRAGYAPHDLQPIDLAIWGGPRRLAPSLRRASTWRRVVGTAKRLASQRPSGPRRVCDLATARLLLARGASYDLPTAAALGDRDRVAAILDEDPGRIRETRPNGRRPLSAAVVFGHASIVRLLLDRGTDPTWPDADAPQGAALHAAARAGDRAMVELLLAHGADPNGYVNASGNATYAAKTAALRALMLVHGGRVDPYDLVWMGEDDEVMRRVMADPESAYAGCGGVYTAVCTLGKLALFKRLLDAGVRVPPLAGGCQSYLLHTPEMLRQLLAAGMSADYANWQHTTLLHLVCSRDIRDRTIAHRTECAAILLDAGATISAKEEEFRSTPLAWAARNNLPDMIEFLLGRGAPTNMPDDQPWATPLAWATRRGHAEIAQTLRRAGASA